MEYLKLSIIIALIYIYINSSKYKISRKAIIALGIVLIYISTQFKESFALPADNTILTDLKALDDNKVYTVGTIKPESQIKTVNASIGGGADCLQFPNNVYKVVPIVPASCSVANGTDQAAVNTANSESNYTFAPRQVRGSELKSTCFSDVNSGVLTSNIGNTNNSCPNNLLTSPDGEFRLVMQQNDGNLVIYKKDGTSIWNSQSTGKGVGPWTLKMQPTGNAVIYDSRGTATWATSEGAGGRAPYSLKLLNGGNLAIYDSSRATPWWSIRPV